jgi:transcriptional regulator with XRE-family HTH domain
MRELMTGSALWRAASDLSAIGQRLAAARKVAGLRQLDIAEIAGVSPNAVTNWEAGTRRMKVTEAARLLPILGIDLNWLYLGDDRFLRWDQREALAAALSHEVNPTI